MMKKLEIFEIQTAKISLEITDKSKKQTYKLIKNILIKIKNHYIPTEFIILETEKYINKSIILNRPFLTTAKTVIDINRKKLIIQINKKSFIFKTQKYPSITIKKKHEKLLSKQNQTEPPQSNSKFNIEKFQQYSEHI
ncbi:hypothetical protein DF186_14040 [Enterococcus hirae]|nr:hypothetical protein DF186_14040 [Enterococcus hirae]